MKNSKPRTRTRVYVMEILYQWLHTNAEIVELINQYKNKNRIDLSYLENLVEGILAKRKEIDEKIELYLEDRELSEVSKIEYAILLVGGYELIFEYDVPYKVAINESVNLAKTYGAQDAHKFVNSVLDRIAKDVRGLETKGY